MAVKRERTYGEITKSYNPELRLKYFDKYRDGVTRKENLDSSVRVKCYVIDELNSSASGGTKHKIIDADIVAIERVMGDGELLFRCICNPKDFVGLGCEVESGKQYVKSFFHRLERMMIEVI
jgi:hypothetical protein